jgi:hypothetical protein
LRAPVLAFLLLAACQAPAKPATDGGGPPPGYPGPPYGTQPGSVIENLTLQSKNVDCDPTVEFYDQLQYAPVSLNDLHQRADLTYLVLVTVAGWCDACNHEQPQMTPLLTKYRARGLRILEVMLEGYNEASAAAATDTDVNHWVTVNSLTVGMALDPDGVTSKYVDRSVSPSMNMVIRLSDLQIVHMAAGEEMLDPVIATLLP